MAECTNDRALRFYNQVLGLDRLHYGLWRQQDKLTIENLKIAEQRYEDQITDNIPSDVTTLLDVGCGTGIMVAKLKSLGYKVEGLTPDINQLKMIKKKANLPVHFCRFEDFKPS